MAVIPATATETNFSYSSSNPAVISVNELGRATALTLGSAVVTVSCGGVRESITITVVEDESNKKIPVKDIIYLHCCGLLEERKEKKLECRVNTYSEWKKGIQQKYEGKKEDFLEEFSRYLQNLININYPILEYNRIAVGVLMSVSLSVLTTEFIQNWNVPLTLSVLETYLLDFFVFLLLMGGIAFVIYATFSPVKDQSMRIAFLNDYKEIIDELIENKKSNSIAN